MSTQPQLSPLEQLGQSAQPAQPQSTTTSPQLSPLEQLGASVPKQQTIEQQNQNPSRESDGGSVPNARIRNLPNPAAKATSPGDALLDGVKTGAQLASIPSAVAGISAGVESAEGATASLVDKAKDVYEWAKTNPIKAGAIEAIARDLGVDPFQLAHKVVKYGKNLFGDSEGTK